jgi:hypothetical protein
MVVTWLLTSKALALPSSHVMNQAIVATAEGHPFGSATPLRDNLTMAACRPDSIQKVVQNLQHPLERISRPQAGKRCLKTNHIRLKANHIRSGRRR